MCHKRKYLEKEYRLNENITVQRRVFVLVVTKLSRESVFESKVAKCIIFESKFVICQKLVPISYIHSTYERHGFNIRFVLSRPKACQTMTQELEMVDESFKKRTCSSLLEFRISWASLTFLL